MRDPKNTLLDLAAVIDIEGLHRGDQFARHGAIDRLDLCAHIYVIANWLGPLHIPEVFFTDDAASLALIESSPAAMAAITALSDALDSTPDEERTPAGLYVPNRIAHVSNWARFGIPGDNRPPLICEAIGVILRAVNHLATHTPAA